MNTLRLKLSNIFRRYDVRLNYFLRIKDKQKILELGCGSGYNYLTLHSFDPSVEYYGVDILPSEDIPEKIIYTQLNLDTEPLPYPDTSFDAIIFTHVIEHLRNPLSLGNEIHRVLKPNGLMYIETPNWTSMLVPSFGFHREQHNPFNFFDDHTHVKPYTKQNLFEYLLQSCDLHVEHVGTVRNWLRIPLDCVRIVSGLLKNDRRTVIASFWNIYGWCIYGIGIKR